MKGNINPKEVTQSITSTLKELDFKSIDGKLSEDELTDLKDEMAKVQLMGYKAKLSVSLTQLAKKSPNLLPKVVLDQMFALLPEDITPAFLPILAAHVVERWEQLTFKKLAA